MIRRLSLLLVLVLVLGTSQLFACELQVTASCTPGINGGPASCTATTTNVGSDCTGIVYTGWFGGDEASTVRFTNADTTLDLESCLDSGLVPSGTTAFPFAFCFGDATIPGGSSFTSTVKISGAPARYPLTAVTWAGNEAFEELSSSFAFINFDGPSCKPSLTAPPIARAETNYAVSWSSVPGATTYVVEESTSPDFNTDLVSRTTSGNLEYFSHNVTSSTRYYYRVRANACQTGNALHSNTGQVVVQPKPPVSTGSAEITVPINTPGAIELQVFVPGLGVPAAFEASVDKPYLEVTPRTGTMPANGQTFTITGTPHLMSVGANTATLRVIQVSLASTGGGAATAAINVPVTVSLVTPVTPGAKTTPTPSSMIIPVVTHVNGAAGPFLSDVRLTNTGNDPLTYQVTLTPTQTDGTTSSKVTEITVQPSKTTALNDIVKNFFGYGATDNPADFGFGALEIRPLNSSKTTSYASSRTYAKTTTGTFGQFIAAVPFSGFATRRIPAIPIPGNTVPPTSLSLQQIAESTKFRTNLGLVEGAGEPASGRIRVLNTAGDVLATVPFSLRPGEHIQWNRFLAVNAGIPTLDDGRIEILIDSDTGAVSAYASVLDNVTTDPLAVLPVDPRRISSQRYTLPGMAELPAGDNNFHSDLRAFNAAPFDVVATLTYYPQGNGPSKSTTRTIPAGQILSVDNALPTLFGVSDTGGSIVITTAVPSLLVLTGRTYTNVPGGGTYGQFIPGVSAVEGIARGDEPLQVLQLEQSDRFRSNLGLAELTGNPVTVRVSLVLPDSLTTPSVNVELAANEFRQLGRVIESLLGSGTQAFNGRITVHVLEGTGRVTAYGSVIDNESKDPTYVPAQ
jgi:hypothetical protein